MRKLLLSLSLLVMTAMTAMAQYKVEITSDPIEDYVCGQQVEFPAADIASALGIDAATLQTMLAAPGEGETKDGLAYIQLADGLSNAYTGNWNEWWMTMDGTPVGYGAEAVWFAGVEYLPAADAQGDVDAVNFYVGQMPGVFKKIYEPSTLKATIVLKNGDKEVSFAVTQNVKAAEKSNLAEPATSFASLEVVKTYDWTVDFLVGKQYEGKTVKTTLDGIYEALGVSQADLDGAIADVVVTRAMSNTAAEGEEPVYVLSDALGRPDDLAGGAWFGRYSNYDEATGEEIVITPNAPLAWGKGHNTIYTQEFKLAEGEFSFVTGQYPDKLAIGDNDIIELYICNGTKAAKVNVLVNVTKPEAIPFEDMTKAGEQTINVEAVVNNDYLTKPFTVDMAAITEALGCEIGDLSETFSFAAEGELSDNHTQAPGNPVGGFFWNEQGYVCAWGLDNGAAFYNICENFEAGSYSVGQMQGRYTDIKEPVTTTSHIIFTYDGKYYDVVLVYTVKPEEQKGDDYTYTKVGEESILMQIVPHPTEYPWGDPTPLDMDYIESKLGTRDVVFMTDKAKEVKDEEGNVIGKELTYFDATYSCDPKPGFWFGKTTYENKEHQVVVENSGWGTNSFGVSYLSSGELTWFQNPGQCEIGEEYMAHLYFVNEATGDYIDYTVVVKYVEEVAPEAETVGHSDVIYKVSADEAADALCVVEINAKKMYAALGLDADLMEAAAIVAQKSSTMFASSALGESLGYNDKGYFVGSDDEENCALQAVVEAYDDKLMVSFDLMSLNFASDDALTIPVRLGVEYDGKRYMYTINLTNKAVDRRIPLRGGSGEGSELSIEVLETDDNGEPLSATYTITDGTWGDNASHLSLFAYKPLSANELEGYAKIVIEFAEPVPASTGEPTYGFIPVGFICPSVGFTSLTGLTKYEIILTDEQKAKGIDDFSIFFNASGDLKSTSLTIKGVYLVTDVDTDPTETGIEAAPAPAATVAPAGIYTISGAKVNALQRGLNIVKMADGSVKKILVK